MQSLSQSSRFALQASEGFELVRYTPLVVKASGSPVLHYVAPLGIWDGAPVHYHLLHGMVRFSWQGYVTAFEGSSFRTKLAPAARGPFADFAGEHSFEALEAGSIVRDSIDFEPADPEFGPVFARTVLAYGFDGRKWISRKDTEAETASFESVRQAKASS